MNKLIPHLLRFCLLWLTLSPLLTASASQHTDVAEIDTYVHNFFPESDRLGKFEGDPLAAAVYRQGTQLGYVFKTDDIFAIPAYSGRPISTLVGVDMQGTIRGVKILHHEEPILAVGIKDGDLKQYVSQYPGIPMTVLGKIGGRDREGYKALDGISGATITVMVINASIMRSLHKVIESRGIKPEGAQPEPVASHGQTLNASIEPYWLPVWQDNKLQIAILVASLLALAFILIFQDWLARHPTFLTKVRIIFLVYTLFYIGWYMLGQLSVVNVLTFFSAITHEFKWDTFLVDPATFLLWGFVAVTLLLWGRGVYCGWLCPFGALQELLNKLAIKMKLRQFEISPVVHERLLALKYIIFIVLFGLSLQSLDVIYRYIEVEPFKTTITMRFDREWQYVSYAVIILLIGLFNRKFYCKYVCPLGAALAIPSRLRLFDWLRRRKECGRPCQTCAVECEVQAIRPTGEINTNECHYCLDCQVTYWNTHKCPPLAEKRRKRERARKLSSKTHQ